MTVVAIQLIPGSGQAPVAVSAVIALAGRGLEGDYNCKPKPVTGEGRAAEKARGEHMTLIDEGAIAHVVALGIPFSHTASRRNVLTRDVDLDAFIGKNFWVGAVACRGVEPCHPCRHLEKHTRPGVLAALVERGGLRVEFLGGGVIREGDAISETRPRGPR